MLIPTAGRGEDDRFPYALKQVVSGDEVFFFDAAWEELVVTERTVVTRRGFLSPEQTKTKVMSNILVHAIPPRPGYAGEIRSVPGLKAWIDEKGNIHSLNTLDAQRAFNDRLIKKRPECAQSGCLLTARRPTPLPLRAVSLTGILDSEALRLPLLSLEQRYDAVARRLDAECGRRGSSACPGGGGGDAVLDFWKDELAAARELLDQYDTLLSSAPVRVPRPIGRQRSYSREHNYNGLGAGLEIIPAAAIGKLGNMEYFVLRPSEEEPELRVASAVDVARLTVEWRARAEEARLHAARKLSRVERLAETIIESTERIPAWP